MWSGHSCPRGLLRFFSGQDHVKTTLKLIGCYVAASYVFGAFSFVIKPLHAHAPGLMVWLMSPLLPYVLAAEVLTLEARIGSVVSLLVFVLLFSGFAWIALLCRRD